MAIFTIARTGSTTEPLNVDLTVGGDAVFGVDYTVSGANSFTTTNASAIIPIGASSVDITVLPIADGILEPAESVILSIVDTPNLVLGNNPAATWTILGNPPSPSSLLLHFDGANGSSSIIDSSSLAASISAVGCSISTNQSKFGGSSLRLLGGNSSYVSVPDSPDLEFGNGDFTIECFLYPEVLGGWVLSKDLVTLVGASQVQYAAINWFGQSILFFKGWTGGFPANFANSSMSIPSIPLNQWSHVAVARDVSIIRAFVNGEQIASVPISTFVNNVPAPLKIGSPAALNQSESGFIGYLDEFRIVVGTCEYTSNFTPPTAPYLN
jgi:hypothetical protein